MLPCLTMDLRRKLLILCTCCTIYYYFLEYKKIPHTPMYYTVLPACCMLSTTPARAAFCFTTRALSSCPVVVQVLWVEKCRKDYMRWSYFRLIHLMCHHFILNKIIKTRQQSTEYLTSVMLLDPPTGILKYKTMQH